MTSTLGAPTASTTILLPWPEPAVLDALQQVDLLATWLERRLEQNLQAQLQPNAPSLASLRHQWFGERAASLFLSRRGDLDQVLLSVLQLEDGHLAQELWFRLHAGEADFAALSHHSIGPEREQGCRIGPVPMAHLDADLAHLLERCQPGELAPPVEHNDGTVLLLRLEQRWPARLDGATRQSLELELYTTWLEEQLAAALATEPGPNRQLTITLPTP
jgi:hypothetical protein